MDKKRERRQEIVRIVQIIIFKFVQTRNEIRIAIDQDVKYEIVNLKTN